MEHQGPMPSLMYALSLVTLASSMVFAQEGVGAGLGGLLFLGGLLILLVGLLLVVVGLCFRPKVKPKTFLETLGESGVVSPKEEVVDSAGGAEIRVYKSPHRVELFRRGGTIVLTDRRILYVQKPSGLFAKGLSLEYNFDLKDILSVTTSGWLTKSIDVVVQRADANQTVELMCEDAEAFAKKMVEGKNQAVEKRTIEAKTVIIEERKKDNAVEILKKRLAKGEITKEEFHDKVQRL